MGWSGSVWWGIGMLGADDREPSLTYPDFLVFFTFFSSFAMQIKFRQ